MSAGGIGRGGWPFAGGEMARRVRTFDWSGTPLGAIEAWPHYLRTATDLVLASPMISTLVCGPELILIYNDAAARLYGSHHPQALGRPLPETFSEGWRTVAPLYDRVFAGESVQVVGQPLDTRGDRDAEQDVFDAGIVPVRDEAGSVVCAFMTGFEVSERLRAQSALHESEERYRAFVTASSDVVYRMSPDWGQMRQLDGRGFLSDTPAPTETWMSRYIHADDLPAVGVAIDHAIRTRSLFELEHRVRRADGSFGWTHSRAVPIVGPGGRIIEWLGSARDVTARKRAEEVLRESEDRQTFLLRLSDALRVLAEPDDIWATACRLLGEHLEADCARYAEFSSDGGRVVMQGAWIRPGTPPVESSHAVEDHEPFAATLRQGGTVVVNDTLDGAMAPSSLHGDMPTGLGIRAAIAVPLIKGSRTVAAISVHSLPPRPWTAAEISLVTEVGERSWAVVERAQAQAALRESEARLAAAFESVPAGVAITDMEGRTVVSNVEYRRFLPTGIIPSRDPARVARWRAWGADGKPIQPADFPGARAMRGERVVPGQAMLYTDDAGREIWTSVATVPLLDGSDEVTGQVTVITDVNASTRNAEALRESEARFRQFATASKDALWIRNAETLAMEFVSPAVQAIYGVAPQHVVGDIERWVELILPEDRPTALEHIETARQGKAVVHEFRIRRPSDGSIRWIRNTDFPLLDEKGRVQRIGGIAQDVTEAKRSAEHQAILLAELQHRVRNTLAVIRSIARRTASSSESVEDYALELDGRLNAFARVQSAVTRNPLAGIDLGYLIAEELMLHATKDGKQVRLEGPPTRLRARAAETLGLAVHELATNAAKYGALSRPGGRIRVTWRHEGQAGSPRLQLTWKESGVTPAHLTPEREGFGTSLLLKTVAYELKAEVRHQIETDGLRYSMLLPLTEAVIVDVDLLS